MTFVDPDDYDTIDQGDELCLDNIFEGLDDGSLIIEDKTKGKKIALSCNFTDRQKNILKAGGLLSFTKQEN